MKKFACLLLAMLMLFSIAACGKTDKDTPAPSGEANDPVKETPEEPTPSEEPAPSEDIEPDPDAETPPAEDDEPAEPVLPVMPEKVNVMVLNGTTGFGMAKLIADASEGNASLNYEFSVESDASNVTAALINGTADIAALPTNAASVVWNKTEGAVQVIALNTLGVLYLVSTDGSTVASFEDLRGKTVYAPAQNPSFIFSYLCKANGLEPGTDVIIDNTYAQPADLRTAVAAGEVALAVLPEPMVTIAKSSSEAVAVQMDLTEQWDKVAPAGSLVQGCVVARTEFAAAYPDAIAAFLGEYEKSIAFLSEDAQAAGAVIEQTGVFAKGAVAAKALPNCNVCFITGEEMKEALAQFLSIMAEAAPASIGGAVPADSFYYIP